MPRRGQRTAHPAAVARTVRPAETSRIGVRRIVVERRGVERTWHIDPGVFACSLLAAQLADEWVIYAEATGIRDPGKQATAVRRFAAFTDAWADRRGVDAGLVRLDGGLVELTEVLFDWEHALRAQFPPPSKAPYSAVGWILALIAQRAARDARVPETLRARAAAPALFDKQPCTVLDEFSQAECLARRDTARRDVRALEERLARGQELLAVGRDPRITGWCAVENLVWAAWAGILSAEAVRPHLPRKVGGWPAPLRELASSVGVGGPGPAVGLPSLILAAASLLFPREIDLQPFRVLLLLGMGDCTPEELLDLQITDMEFTDGGVRIRQTKARADRIRGVLHTSVEPVPGHREERGAGQRDVPGLLRRLVAVTEPARARSDGAWLFTAVEFQGTGCRRIAPAMAQFTREGRRLTHWIAQHDGSDGHPMLQVSEPHHARRLRKTAKTARVVALGGTLVDLAADDHHIEVFRTHYAHGTTAHVLAARAVTGAQKKVFGQINRALLIPAEAEEHLTKPAVAQAAGLDAHSAQEMPQGQLDMGLVNCRDPYASPYTPAGKACHVAPAMCMLCRNAVVFTSQLPRLVLLAEHIEVMRHRLPPASWQAVWAGRPQR